MSIDSIIYPYKYYAMCVCVCAFVCWCVKIRLCVAIQCSIQLNFDFQRQTVVMVIFRFISICILSDLYGDNGHFMISPWPCWRYFDLPALNATGHNSKWTYIQKLAQKLSTNKCAVKSHFETITWMEQN